MYAKEKKRERAIAERMQTGRMRSVCCLLLSALAAMAMVSCGGSDDSDAPEPPQPVETQRPISFSGGMQEEETVTRADGLETKGIHSFIVYGFKNTGYEASTGYTDYQMVFPGYTVNWKENSAATTITNSDGWEYVAQEPLGHDEQTVKYWDWSAKAYRFFGVAGTRNTNVPEGVEMTIGSTKVYRVTYTADANNRSDTPYYSHLWFSDGTPGYASFGQPVQLQFILPLSTVRLMFIFEEYEEKTEKENEGTANEKRYIYDTGVSLTDISFKPSDNSTIKQSGQVTVTFSLTETATTETFAADADAEGITAFTLDYYEKKEETRDTDPWERYPYYNAKDHLEKQEYTVLPVTNQGTYTLTVNVDGQPKRTVVPAEFMDWRPGYRYTYIFKVHVDGSVDINNVQSAFTPWEFHEDTHTVYNW